MRNTADLNLPMNSPCSEWEKPSFTYHRTGANLTVSFFIFDHASLDVRIGIWSSVWWPPLVESGKGLSHLNYWKGMLHADGISLSPQDRSEAQFDSPADKVPCQVRCV